MRVTFSLALSSLQFDPQTQLSSAPDLIKLLCTDSHQADKYSVTFDLHTAESSAQISVLILLDYP